MPMFTLRDRIAILAFGALILTGWGIRLARAPRPADDMRIIRNAATLPPAVVESGSLPNLSVAPRSANPVAPSRIDLNRAAAAELETLPLIGPAKAAAIIRWREEHGPFAKPSDITKVKGIGPKIYERIAPYVATGDSGG